MVDINFNYLVTKASIINTGVKTFVFFLINKIEILANNVKSLINLFSRLISK